MSSQNVLAEIDWDDGFHIPVASEANKALETDVQQKQKQLLVQRQEAEIHEKRSQALKDHLTHVKQDLKVTIQLLAAKRRESESEKHQRMISDREYGRLKQEIQRLKEALDENHEQKIRFENKIYLANNKTTELRDEISWDQKKLEQWLEESSKQDDNVLTLHKYMKEDDSKLKQLMLTMERLTEEVRNARNTLDAEKTETLSAQIAVDKTAEDFRKKQSDREELIRQWKQTLDQMKRRDSDIGKTENLISNEQELLKQGTSNLNSKRSFYDEEVQNNNQLEKEIEHKTREAKKLIEMVQAENTEKEQVDSEVQTAKFLVDRVTTDLEQLKQQNKTLQNTKSEKSKKLANLKNQTQFTKENLQSVEEQQLGASQKASVAERILNHEKSIVKSLTDQVKQAREMQFKREQELKKADDEQVVLSNTVNGNEASQKNLKKRLEQIDNQCLQQQEVIYQQKYQMVNIDRRLSKLQGEGMDQEEKERLETKIRNLNENLESKQATNKVVTQQLKKLGDEVRRVDREMQKTDSEYKDLEAKIAEMDLQYESSQRELSNLEKANNGALVDDNLLRLEISRLRGSLSERVDSVVNLSQKRLQLNTAIKERKIQINNMKAMVNAELKASEEERSTLSHDLHERMNKITKIRNRYDSLMILMAPPEGETEETQSQAYYIIKAAQEKEELQRYGDKLDRDIKTAEAENEALINTTRLVKAKNKKMQEALAPTSVDNSSEFKELDKRLKAAQEKIKSKRQKAEELQRQILDLKDAINYANENETNARVRLGQLTKDLEVVDKQIVDQKQKFIRADKAMNKFDRTKFSDHQNLDLSLRELRFLITGAGRLLQTNLKNQDEIVHIASAMMNQIGVDPGSIFSNTGSSTAFSRTSSLNSSKLSTPRRTPPNIPIQNIARPPSVASSLNSKSSSKGSKTLIKKNVIKRDRVSTGSSRHSDLSLSGSKIEK